MRMRKTIYQGSKDEGRALLARAPTVHLAMVSGSGAPILRALNAVVLEGLDGQPGSLAFHGAPAGQKMEGVGQRVVVSAEQTVASIPSYFLDPERACPATTYYVSVQVEGVVAQVDDPARKAEVLAALMAKYQPEGGYVPLAADHPLYAKALAGLLVAEVSLEHLSCKAKLGQNRQPEERRRVIEQLWKRGGPGDVEAIAQLLAHSPELGAPSFLRLPTALAERGLSLQCHLAEDEVDDAIALLQGLYWLADIPRAEIRAAVASSTAVVAARDASGRIVGFARALSDGKCAWIYDVAVAPPLRSGGVGHALMAVLLDHPRVRGVRHVRLTTRDAMRFYRRLGFTDLAEAPRYAWTSTEMIRTAPRAVVRHTEETSAETRRSQRAPGG